MTSNFENKFENKVCGIVLAVMATGSIKTCICRTVELLVST